MTTRERKRYDLYVDDKHFATKDYAWPMLRILTQMRRAYPDSLSLEVRLREEESSIHILVIHRVFYRIPGQFAKKTEVA